MEINEITGQIVDAAIEVHRTLGPGLLESVYQKALARELELRGFSVKTEVTYDVTYKGVTIADGFRLDILVNDEVIIELKSVEELKKVHFKQLLTYLKLLNKNVGLLINFNVPLLKEGLHRVMNDRIYS